MANEMSTSLAVVLADGTLYEKAPVDLRERLKARLHEADAPDPGLRQTVPPAQIGGDHLAEPQSYIDVKDDARIHRPADTAHAREIRASRGTRRFFGFSPDRRVGWSFAGGGFAGVAVSVLLGMTVLRGMPFLSASSAQPQATFFEQQIVASHVRALISSREMDVLSSDQHTVKPWFNGRIDYAPPVVDPKAYGFPLVGGRLDYVGERAVAVMVYRYLKHPIDLYVFPAAGDGAAGGPSSATSTTPSVMSKQGYSIIKWQRNGMVFWAITDASMSNLIAFVDAVKRMT